MSETPCYEARVAAAVREASGLKSAGVRPFTVHYLEWVSCRHRVMVDDLTVALRGVNAPACRWRERQG